MAAGVTYTSMGDSRDVAQRIDHALQSVGGVAAQQVIRNPYLNDDGTKKRAIENQKDDDDDDDVSDDDGDEDYSAGKPAHVRELFTRARNNRHHDVEQMLTMGMAVSSGDRFGNTVLHVACQNGDKKMAKIALRWGADIDARNMQGQSPLHYAFAYNCRYS
jgi:ankyrin repeat protein